MSAFIVNYSVINNILSVAENYDLIRKCCYLKSELGGLFGENKYGFIDDKILSEVGKEFLKLNIEAVNQRYNDNDDFEYAEKYQYKNTKVSLIQSIKSLDCLKYQCTEGDCMERETYKKLETLKKILIGVYFYTNDEYNQAEWG